MFKVFIGVGHGGADGGAVANGLIEKDVNLVMANAMANYLIKYDVNVLMSRTKDETDRLYDKIKEANSFAPDIAIDVHNNAGGGDGFEAFIQNNIHAKRSKLLALLIEREIKLIGQNSRGIKSKLNSNSTDYYGFLREINCPAIICEGFFLDNLADKEIGDKKSEQEKFGIAYAKAILKYFGIEEKPISKKFKPNEKFSISVRE